MRIKSVAFAAWVLFLAGPFLAGPADAQLGGFFLAKVHGGVSPGTPTALTVLSNGWQAQVTLATTTCGGSLASYSLTPDATPKVSLTVTSPGYNTSGTLGTINRTVIGTVPLRQPYNNGTLPTETQSGANCVVTTTLSDFVNPSDTATASLLSGAYTGSLSASGLSVTNSSTSAYQPPVCNWVTPPYQVISSSANFTVEAVCFDARPLNQSQIASIKFSESDGTHTYTCLTSSMAELTDVDANGPKIYGYKCTFTSGTFTSLTAGVVTRDAIAYPWVGNPLTFSAGQDGVSIPASTITSNLHAVNDVYDTTGKYAPAYAWVCFAGNTGCTAGATGTCATIACVSASATDPGLAATANYPDVSTALTECQAWNASNRSHTDMADCLVNIRAVNGFNGWGTANIRTGLTAGPTWAKVEAAPGQSNTTVVDTPQASPCDSNLACADIPDKFWMENIGFTQADTAFAQHNGLFSGGDAAATISADQVCNKCAFTTTASGYPSVFQVSLIRWVNSTFNTATNGAVPPYTSYGATVYADTFIGNSITSAAGGRAPIWDHLLLGNYMQGMEITYPTSATDCSPTTGPIVAFNKDMDSADPFEADFNPNTACFPNANFFSVQNVYEAIGSSFTGFNFLGDSNETVFVNGVQQYDSVYGNRENVCYNEGTGPSGVNASTAKSVQIMWSLFDTTAGSPYGLNKKSDYYSTGSASRIGNWPCRFGVGSPGNVLNEGTDSINAPSDAAWIGDYVGRTGSTTANNEGYAQTVTPTTNNSTSGTATGNGNYKPTGSSGSAAYGRVYSGTAALPFDITGTARRNDGTGCAGAYECFIPFFFMIARRRKSNVANDNSERKSA